MFFLVYLKRKKRKLCCEFNKNFDKYAKFFYFKIVEAAL